MATVVGLAGLLILGVAGSVVASDQFSDVGDGNAFHDDISWMADTGISEGYPDGTFRPNIAVTRQAMAAFMNRLAGTDPEVDPMVQAEHAEHADNATNADQLGSNDPDHYVSSPGSTRTAILGGAWRSNRPGRTVNIRNVSEYSRWEMFEGANFLYAAPQIDTRRFGEPQYLHLARTCVDPVVGPELRTDPAPVVKATLEVWETTDDGGQDLVHEVARTEPFSEEGCFTLSVDTCPLESLVSCGFQLGDDDAVALRLKIDSPVDGARFETRMAYVDTSSESSRGLVPDAP